MAVIRATDCLIRLINKPIISALHFLTSPEHFINTDET